MAGSPVSNTTRVTTRLAAPSWETGDGAGATPPGLGPVSLDQPSDGAAHAAFSFAMATSVDRNVSCTDPDVVLRADFGPDRSPVVIRGAPAPALGRRPPHRPTPHGVAPATPRWLMHSDPASWDAHLRDRRRRVHQPSCAPRPAAPPASPHSAGGMWPGRSSGLPHA